MARIRSIHPGIFTDEAFMEASMAARIMVVGLWCEAWDDGVFEWKPAVLKARLFPVDNLDTKQLLSELEALNIIHAYSYLGKSYGVIRNFQKFQRPKKPNSSGALPVELEEYVGKPKGSQGSAPYDADEQFPTEAALIKPSSEPVPNWFPTGGEKSPQMEDGGWRMEDGETLTSFVSVDASPPNGGEPPDNAKPTKPTKPATPKRKPASKAKPGNPHPLPEDWEPDDKAKELARSLGFKKTHWETSLAEFKDFWISRKGRRDGLKTNWSATFHNQLLRSAASWKLVPVGGEGRGTARDYRRSPSSITEIVMRANGGATDGLDWDGEADGGDFGSGGVVIDARPRLAGIG